MGNMIPVCTERDSTCAKREGFGTKSNLKPDKVIVFHAEDCYLKKRRKKRRKKLK